jgi:hypothetical protein
MLKTDRRKAEKEGTPRMMFTGSRSGGDGEIAVTLDDLAREGARRMIGAALKAEADEYVASLVDEVDEHASGWSCATAGRVSGE